MKSPDLRPEYLTSHAVVVGINDYRAAPPLLYAVNDAAALRDELVTRFGFADRRVQFLTNEQATRSGIMSSFCALQGDATEKDDRVVFFFAGHGVTRRGSRGEVGFLVPCDGNPSDLSTLVRWEELCLAAQLIQAKHVLFLMDACYSGLALPRGIAQGSTRFVSDMLLRSARQVITAGKADEVVADSGGPRAGHSVFTGHLLDALEGGAADADGILTANGLMAYVYAHVSRDASSRQTPHFGYIEGDGDFVFAAPVATFLTPTESAAVRAAAHNIRAMLHTIRGTMSALFGGHIEDAETAKLYQDRLLAVTDHFARITDWMLTSEKLGRQTALIRLADCDLVTLLVDCAESVRHLHARQPATVQVHSRETNLHMQLDPDRMKDVFIALLDNACRFSPAESPVVVDIVATRHEAVVTIRDRGIGIPEEELGQVFDRGFVGEGVRALHYDGSGLGLFLAKTYVEAHGGAISARSEGRNRGTVLTVTLRRRSP